MDKLFFYSARHQKVFNLRGVLDVDLAPDLSWVVIWRGRDSLTLEGEEAGRFLRVLGDHIEGQSGELFAAQVGAVAEMATVAGAGRR